MFLRGDNHSPAGRLQAGFQPAPVNPVGGPAGVEAVREQNLAPTRAGKNHPAVVRKAKKTTFDADQDRPP